MQVSPDSRSGPKVFISYRRADTADVTGRIRDRLLALGVSDVFMDVESIDLGENFRKAVADAIDKSDVVLVVMCPAWRGIADARGRRLVLPGGGRM